MATRTALIDTYSKERRASLCEHFTKAGLVPRSMDETIDTMNDLQTPPAVLVVDMKDKVSEKVRLVEGTWERFPGTRVITIGRRSDLVESGAFNGRGNVAMIDRIDEL